MSALPRSSHRNNTHDGCGGGAGFWRETHSPDEEDTLIAEMDLRSADFLRALLVGFLLEAKNGQACRNFVRIFDIADKEF